MEDWNIQTRHASCTRCSAPFMEKQMCHTLLSVREGVYQRDDICSPCWEGAGADGFRHESGVVSYWQGIFELPEPPPPDPLPKEDAESLLRLLQNRNLPEEAETRFILAVMLERKRILRQRPVSESEPEMLVYEHTKTGEIFLVRDPNIQLSRLPEVQQRVAYLLRTGTHRATSSLVPEEHAMTEPALPG